MKQALSVVLRVGGEGMEQIRFAVFERGSRAKQAALLPALRPSGGGMTQSLLAALRESGG